MFAVPVCTDGLARPRAVARLLRPLVPQGSSGPPMPQTGEEEFSASASGSASEARSVPHPRFSCPICCPNPRGYSRHVVHGLAVLIVRVARGWPVYIRQLSRIPHRKRGRSSGTVHLRCTDVVLLVWCRRIENALCIQAHLQTEVRYAHSNYVSEYKVSRGL